MTNSKHTFWSLLQDCTIHKITIPRYQRDYAQGRGENKDIAQKFVQDLVSALDKEQELSLGLIYGCTKDGELQIVDGQQRFTMLWLFHLYIMQNVAGTDLAPIRKFTYNTRLSANRFCEFISSDVLKGNLSINTIKQNIKFQHTWLHDPTVAGMLEVLSILEKTIAKNDYVDFFSKLTTKSSPIVFDYLSIEGITSDSVYMLMNSRGLQLTSFEHFKSMLYAGVKNQSLKDKLDVEYTDYFWETLSIDKIDGASLDNTLLTYIQEYARVRAYKKDLDCKSEMTKRRGEWVSWFEESDYSSEFEIKTDALIKYASDEQSRKLLSSLKSTTYNQRLELYAHLEFYNKIPNDAVGWEEVYRVWYRVISNVINNTENVAQNYKDSLELIDLITSLVGFNIESDFYSAVANSTDERKNEQWLQEKHKAHLISKGLIEEQEIVKAEQINGFDGNIRFLLSFEETKDRNDFNNTKFIEYSNVACYLLDNKKEGKSNFAKDYLLMRAILTYNPQITKGIYLWDIHKYLYEYLKNYTDNPSVIELRKATQNLVKELSNNSLYEIAVVMQNRIDGYQLKDDKKNIAYWRMVKYPDILMHCSEYNYIYPYWGNLRLFYRKNWNWQDYNLEADLVKDVADICSLFGKDNLIGKVYEKEGDVFYRNIENNSFEYKGIALHLIVENSHVSIGIKSEANLPAINPPAQWGASEDKWWASVLTFPVGEFENYKAQIEKYKEYLGSIRSISFQDTDATI